MIPVLDYLGELGVRKSTFTEFLCRYPQVLNASVVVDLAPVVKNLQGMDIKPNDVPRVLEKYPEVLGFKLEGTMNEFGRVVEKMPQIVSLSDRAIVKHVDFLKECGFSSKQVKKMVVGCPQLLALNTDIMKLTYGLESTIKPRHKMVAKKGLKCSLAWLLNCSDEKFEERMNYDSMDMEDHSNKIQGNEKQNNHDTFIKISYLHFQSSSHIFGYYSYQIGSNSHACSFIYAKHVV
ncbi:Mitochondrial transcription termination factor family protein [Forsythia ovata]|uniref:Mitochondrial transcription termination factor family protein n=1 Tax=Forsythia ovata TaxID=205694 RepID=A0ABD1PYS8_9LAMI